MQKRNIVLDTDSYKISHWLQYPPNTKRVVNYIEARGTNYEYNPRLKDTLFFGIQSFIEDFLMERVTQEDIDEARWYFEQHGVKPWNEEGWQVIVDEFDGYLPLKVRSVREGVRVPFKNVLVTVENTDDRFFWLPTYVETAILRAVWYGTTVATISRDIKDLLLQYHEKMSDEDLFGVNFKLHDFGCRGASSYQSAELGGAAHLVNFMGTDTVPALRMIRRVYGDEDVAGFSIPASEHSTMTTWGRENEKKAILNMIQQFGGENTLLACVMDSYDIWNVLENLLPEEILGATVRSHGGTLVVRPDSGCPMATVVKVINTLMEKFGFTVNSKGYRVLPPYLRVIQGDGVNRDTIERILHAMDINSISIDNIAFGMGGALLQEADRDTFKFAMKCSAVKIGDGWQRVSKSPVGDKMKKSKEGYLDLKKDENGRYFTKDVLTPMGPVPEGWTEMEVAYENGSTWQKDLFADVRARSNK